MTTFNYNYTLTTRTKSGAETPREITGEQIIADAIKLATSTVAFDVAATSLAGHMFHLLKTCDQQAFREGSNMSYLDSVEDMLSEMATAIKGDGKKPRALPNLFKVYASAMRNAAKMELKPGDRVMVWRVKRDRKTGRAEIVDREIVFENLAQVPRFWAQHDANDKAKSKLDALKKANEKNGEIDGGGTESESGDTPVLTALLEEIRAHYLDLVKTGKSKAAAAYIEVMRARAKDSRKAA